LFITNENCVISYENALTVFAL